MTESAGGLLTGSTDARAQAIDEAVLKAEIDMLQMFTAQEIAEAFLRRIHVLRLEGLYRD